MIFGNNYDISANVFKIRFDFRSVSILPLSIHYLELGARI